LPPPTGATTGYAPPAGATRTNPAPPPALPPPSATGTSASGPAPSPTPTSTPSAGLLSSPGAYEEWIKANSSQLNDPTRVEGLYDSGAAGVLSNSPLSGISNTDSAASYRDWLANNSTVTGAGNSAGVLSGLSTGPSNSTSVYTNASGTLTKPGAVEDVYAKNSAAFNAPGTGEDFYSKYGDQQMQNTATESAFGQYGGGFDDAGAQEAWYAKYGGDPMAKSYTETLYEGGIGQLDPAYQYAQDQALKAARTASAARSQFNSTYAGQEERDLAANIRGQQASKWVDLAPQADQAKRARYDQGERFAGDSQDAYNKRLLNMFDIAGQKDKSTFDRFDQGERFAGDANDQYRQRILDTFGIAGLNDKAGQDRLDLLSTIASRGDSADTARDNTRVNAASNADRSAADIYQLERDAQATGSTLTRQQGDQNIDLATAQDSANRANLNSQFNLAGAADSADIGRLLTQGGFAKDLQTTGQNRVIGGLDQTADQGQREAELVNQVYGDTRGIENMDDTQLQALASKYGVSLQELESIKGDAKAVIDLFTQAAKALL
jgi:hypothetical protein